MPLLTPSTMPSPTPLTMPSTPIRRSKHPDLTRNQRIQCLTLRSADWTYNAIAHYLGLTQRQVQTACSTDHPTPKKCKGRNATLSEAQVNELKVFICCLRTNRLMSYLHLATSPFTHWNISEYIIRNALRK